MPFRGLGIVGCLLLVISLPALGEGTDGPPAPPPAFEPTEKQLKVHRLGQRCFEAGVRVTGVRMNPDDTYEIFFGKDARAEDRARVAALETEVMSAPLVAETPTEVHTLNDALVVLRFEPDNEAARRVVREHYLELKSKTSEQD